MMMIATLQVCVTHADRHTDTHTHTNTQTHTKTHTHTHTHTHTICVGCINVNDKGLLDPSLYPSEN